MMEGLCVPDRRYVGSFRGEPDLERTQVRVGANYGVDSVEVSQALTRFETKLQALVRELDALSPMDQELDADQLAAVIDLCAWVHAEWIRIHPFANGNGRTARLWANSLAVLTDFPHSSACVQGPTRATEMPVRIRCKAAGNRQRLSFAACSANFWLKGSQSLHPKPLQFNTTKPCR
jgi:fido (protein-threonine AMPylation protein)